MYQATFTLLDKAGKTLHVENQKFGFRTIETRESDDLYINGRRVMICLLYTSYTNGEDTCQWGAECICRTGK